MLSLPGPASHRKTSVVQSLSDGLAGWAAGAAAVAVGLLLTTGALAGSEADPDWALQVFKRVEQIKRDKQPLAVPQPQPVTEAPPPIKETGMDPLTKTQIVLFFAALLGSAAKSWATNTQATLSKRSILDVFIGGIAGLLVPIYAPALIPQGVNLISAAAVMCFIAYSSSDFIQNALGKLGQGVSAQPLTGTGTGNGKVVAVPPPPPVTPVVSTPAPAIGKDTSEEPPVASSIESIGKDARPAPVVVAAVPQVEHPSLPSGWDLDDKGNWFKKKQ